MKPLSARKKFLSTTLESTRKSYYPQLLKQLESSKENAKSLQLLIDNMPALISYIDKDLNYVLVNREYEKTLGLRREIIVGSSLKDSFNQKGFLRIEKFFNDALEGNSGNFEEELDIGGFGKRWYDISYVPYLSSTGEVNGFYTLIIDLTEKRREKEEKEILKDRLRQSQKMEAIGTLASGIAHDFNNILSGIFGYSQLITNNFDNRAKIEKYVGNIVDSAKRASTLIQQILTFSRQSKSTKQPIRIDLLIKDVVFMLRSTLPSSIEVVERINTKTIINADSTQIHQVVMNLCTNAFHAMNDGGVLTVELDEVEAGDMDILGGDPEVKKKALLTVKDTGHGIDNENLDKIFDPYFTTKDIGKGTGLGLSVVSGIVKKHKGFIKVESTKWKGSEFKVYFPVISKEDKTLPGSVLKEDENFFKGNEKILLVDDEPAILKTLKMILEGKGYIVEAFENGKLALDAFKEKPDYFDIVVTDMTMPKMKGDILASEILKVKPDIPVIVLSGYLEEMIETVKVKDEIKKFLQKPVLGSELLKSIREVLDQ